MVRTRALAVTGAIVLAGISGSACTILPQAERQGAPQFRTDVTYTSATSPASRVGLLPEPSPVLPPLSSLCLHQDGWINPATGLAGCSRDSDGGRDTASNGS